MVDTTELPVIQRKTWSLRTTLIALGVGAFVYVALIGIALAVRIGPSAAGLQRQSAGVLSEFEDSRRRVDALDSALTNLWRHLGASRTSAVSIDTLEMLRRRLQQLANQPLRTAQFTGPDQTPADLRAALVAASGREDSMSMALFGAIAALELRDVPAAERQLRHADSVDTPLNDALSDATAIALRDVNRHEAELERAATQTTRLVWIWLVAGIILLPLIALLLRARLYQPLAAIDRGLKGVSRGDLSTSLHIERGDELGRLAAHFNRMTAVLRQRALEEEQRMADETAVRTRSIIDAAPDAVAVVDSAGLVREWNPKAQAVFGWRRDELIGQSIAEHVFPPHILVAYRADVLAGTSVILNRLVETTAYRRDGTEFPVEITITPMMRGTTREFSVFVRDISERHLAQAALGESEARFRAAFEQAAVGMIETGSDGRFIRVNRAFAEIVGRPVDELAGMSFLEISHPDDVSGDVKSFGALLSGQLAYVEREKRYIRPDGEVAWVMLTSALVRDASGAPSYALAIVQNVTERKRLEGDLLQVQKMDAVGRLAGGIAHDFNNLLAGIMGYADLLHHADEASPSMRADALAIVATAQRGADLAQNLLTLARRTPSRAEPVDLNEVVSEVRELVSRTFDRRVDVRLDLAADAPVVVGDRSHLSNALLNLAVNARDAMPDGGRLTFTTRRLKLDAEFCARHADSPPPGEYVAVSVSDTGVGMSAETRARIFEPFYTTKAVGKGTGLGLAMVYGAVRSHNGLIEVDSAPGKGATFTLFFPRAEGDEQQPATDAATLVIGRGRILLADDEPIVREVATRMIERLGYTVDSVGDGQLAVERLTATPDLYDLVLLDGDMPRLSGREAARQIRAAHATVPLLLATGYLSPDDSEPLEAYGFDAALAKPYTLSALSRLLGDHMPVG